MDASTLTRRVTQKRRRFAGTFTALLLLATPAFGFTGQRAGAGPNSQTPPAAPATSAPLAKPGRPLSRVTIEAARDRHALRRRVNKFVNAMLVRHWNETMIRWDVPICLLVAGLPRQYGEFVFDRISQAAKDAHVRLARKKCQPNLYVVVTADPHRLLNKWWDRDKTMYDVQEGIAPVRGFVDSKRPIRVWYNKEIHCKGGAPASSGTTAGVSLGVAGDPPPIFMGIDCFDTLLEYGDVRGMMSAIVVVDWRQVKNVTFEQMADYAALIGLADVRLDPDRAPTQSILSLFARKKPPQGLTSWDRALLYSLYNTNESSKLRVQEMEWTMVSRIAR
ncbi:MAG TPA: hypothetical protein VHV80_05730 [Steroidobacteraceae bacterium]|jgi:hypothetical protein|nr:hypothetical protein [Steroidobacteraceae bacterium]